MSEIATLIIIGLGLSMDALSASLGVGTFINNRKKIYFLSILVGVFHFFMPIIGYLIGKNIIEILNINLSIVLGIILTLIALEMFIDTLKTDLKYFHINLLTMALFSFTVSIDSFTTGMGLKGVTDNLFLSSVIFSVCAFVFTLLGLNIGKYGSKYLGKYANILGIILLLLIAIKSFFV